MTTAYFDKAQPYLDAIGSAVFASQSVRDWLMTGTDRAEVYRGACRAEPGRCPKTIVLHDDWLTVIFCGDAETRTQAVAPFDRGIGHREARRMIPDYPSRPRKEP